MASVRKPINSKFYIARFRDAHGHEFSKSTRITTDDEAQEVAEFFEYKKRKINELEDAIRSLMKDPREYDVFIEELTNFYTNLYIEQHPGLPQKLRTIRKNKSK